MGILSLPTKFSSVLTVFDYQLLPTFFFEKFIHMAFFRLLLLQLICLLAPLKLEILGVCPPTASSSGIPQQ
jgi:hypothetical protein